MSIEDFSTKMKSIQIATLEFLEDESVAEKKYENLVNLISALKIINDKHEFEALLHLISSIASNHQRVCNFISKIEQLLALFKKDISQYFTNSEIFEIFKGNKRILLFLIEEKMMKIDEYIFSRITGNLYDDNKYCEYFLPEIKPFLTTEMIKKYKNMNRSLQNDKFVEELKKEVDEDFYEKRKEGENDDSLCKLIRLNEIKEFVKFVEQRNLSLKMAVKKSIFETNQLLAKKGKIKLIEYAAFFGSNDIIKYMVMNEVELTSNMWIYAIHSGNAELIKYLEDNHVSPPEKIINSILKESIKCHHNEIAKYIIDNLIKEEDLQNDNLYEYAVEYNNYCFFPENMKSEKMFLDSCQFGYFTFVKLYLEVENIDVNIKSIKISNI
ncbi:hypothetical protein M9Y10_019685 [Tritrichomonas musculus]|uniref:DUF3447 domain-containing protein n=1 Tax=Tritrichomonas musculus TaxID=1915356 RepID=A0ABR2HH15_9EUKA